jgi:hypothetical protein
MSGIEVAGLAVGIIPIFVEILKSYSAAKRRLQTFTHYTQVAYDVQLRYGVAEANFGNECQLLLKAVVTDALELSLMVDDPHHSGWRNVSLEPRFRKFLKRDHQLCEEIVIKIRDILRDTQAKLSTLNEQVAGQDDSQESVVRRVYQAFTVARKESQYYRWLDDLDLWNKKLRNLRSQRCKLQKQNKYASSCIVRKAMPRDYTTIRAASQNLHESLQDSWSCTNLSHTGHKAKLSLNAKAEYGTARLDMVIACRKQGQR